jgi:hypothetical protein
MSRVRRGFKLAGVSWRVVVAEPAILVVLAIGLAGMVLVSGGLFLLLFRRFPSADDFQFPNYLIALPVLGLGSVVTTYCNVVVSVMADRRLRGQEPTVRDGIDVATEKLDRIVSWTLLSIAVGLLLQLIAERLRLAGAITARLLGMAWNLGTMFVIPVIALEDLSVSSSIRRSASIFKSKWGESVVAQGTIGLAVMFAVFPLMAIVALCAAISAPLAIGVGIVLLGGLMLVSGALDAVVDVALYRYALDGTVLGAFTAADLDGSFQPKRRDF